MKKIAGVIMLITILTTSLIGCTSSTDPLTDATKFFATISRIERETPGGLGLTKEEATELLKIINPVVAGMPLTEELAKEMLQKANSLLTKEQLAMIKEKQASLGTPSQTGTGTGTGMGNGGGTGTGTSTAGSGTNTGNMFLRLDQQINDNYLK